MRECRVPAVVLAGLIASTATGCGTVLHGRTQLVAVSTQPPGAQVSIDGKSATSPATLEVQRKPLTVVRASAPGYYHTCRVVTAPRRRGLMAMDIIFLGVPLIVDAVVGMDQLRSLPPEIVLPMIPATKREPEPLPDDVTIIAAFRARTDLCAPSSTTGSTRTLAMTAGDVSVPYTILGTVRVKAKGRDAARATSPIFFRRGGLPAQEPEHEHVTVLLQDEAVLRYGDEVDALINVLYRGDARSGDVSAEGLAVRFVDRPGPKDAASGQSGEPNEMP